VGPNGAGKSVLVNVITGFYQASAGHIFIGDNDISLQPAHVRARMGLARTFQNIRLFLRMTVLENVMVAMKQHTSNPLRAVFCVNEKSNLEKAMSLLQKAGLASKANDAAGSLAYGEARRLEIARALAGDPHILLLDEPAAGMNDRETKDLAAYIHSLRDIVQATIVIEHDMGFLRGLCDRMVVLDYGRVIANGTVADVLKNPRVVEAYLGIEA
jgi:branched-chain amino acid transport system ATP-binding protein